MNFLLNFLNRNGKVGNKIEINKQNKVFEELAKTIKNAYTKKDENEISQIIKKGTIREFFSTSFTEGLCYPYLKTICIKPYVIENIMMFIPFGFLMPWLISGLRAGVWCSLAGLCCSGVIEIAQKITGRGYFQVDDLAMNTLGALFGWMCWKVFDCLWKRGGKEKS